jgi:hypothetical protein
MRNNWRNLYFKRLNVSCGIYFSERILEVELAQQILKSELLVSEDEDFISNFILSKDILEKYQVSSPDSSTGSFFQIEKDTYT